MTNEVFGDANPSGRRKAAHLEDLELVQRALADEPSAREHLWSRFQQVPGILAACNARMNHPIQSQDLSDLVQDCLVLIWRKLPSYEGRASLKTWIFQICSLELMNAARKVWRAKRALPTIVGAGAALDQRSAPDLARGEAELERGDLLQGLLTLRREEHLAIWLKHHEELTFPQIAERMTVSQSKAKALYYTALRRLRHFLTVRREGRG